jgi:hypothetical protein
MVFPSPENSPLAPGYVKDANLISFKIKVTRERGAGKQ